MKYDNESIDGKVGFIEEGHIYEMKDDKSIKFNSVTTLIKDYEIGFDSIAQSERVSKKKNSKYYGQDPKEIRDAWEKYANIKSAQGTLLHEYGQKLLEYVANGSKGKKPRAPKGLVKGKWVPKIVDKLLSEYVLAKAELLVYSTRLKLAGQSDIILKKKWKHDEKFSYAIYDWKFLSKKLAKKSYYNPYTRKYANMKGPFKYLMDCNWIHYSIQLAIYQTMSGDPTNIREKVLVIVYDDNHELVPCYPMRVFWDSDNKLQAVYEIYNGKIYDSRTDKLTSTWPKDILGR